MGRVVNRNNLIMEEEVDEEVDKSSREENQLSL